MQIMKYNSNTETETKTYL